MSFPINCCIFLHLIIVSHRSIKHFEGGILSHMMMSSRVSRAHKSRRSQTEIKNLCDRKDLFWIQRPNFGLWTWKYKRQMHKILPLFCSPFAMHFLSPLLLFSFRFVDRRDTHCKEYRSILAVLIVHFEKPITFEFSLEASFFEKRAVQHLKGTTPFLRSLLQARDSFANPPSTVSAIQHVEQQFFLPKVRR